MINFNIKTLFNKSKPEETSVSINPEIEKLETPKELFDNAVAQVVKEQIKHKVKEELFRLVYGQECFDHTKAVLKKYTSSNRKALVKEYPKMHLVGDCYGDVYPSLNIDKDDLIRYLTNRAYNQVYGETNGN